MKKTLILILVVLMALFAVSVITAQTEEPVQTDPAAAVTEPAAEGAEPTSDQPAAEEKQPEEQPAAGEEQPQEESNPETPAETPDVTEEGGDTSSDTPAAAEENVETPADTPAAAEENVETPTNTPDVTEEGGDTPTDTPDVTEENVETPTDTPAAAEGTDETPTNTPDVTEEGADTPTDTPEATEGTVDAPTDTPAAAEGTDETPANTPEVTDTPDPAETAAPETTAPAPAEDEDSVIYMTVTIDGAKLTVKYDENDTNTYTAEGFTVLSVDCTNDKGETVACPSFNEKKDLIFDGTDRAELPGNKCGKADMGLSEDQFSLDLKAENVEVSFVVIDGYVEVVEDYTEPEVIDQTGTDEPEEEPEEKPEETEPEDEDQETEKPAEEASDDVIVYSSSCMTLRLIKKPAKSVEEPAAEPAAAASEGEEENDDELNENEEELNKEGEDQNGDDLNNDAEDLKDEDEKENIEEQNEDDEEKGKEDNAEDQDKDEEDLNEEDKKENIEEQNEDDEEKGKEDNAEDQDKDEEDLNEEDKKENAEEQNEKDEEKDAEDTDKDGFHTIVSGDGSAAGVIPEVTDPAAGEGENTEAGEETEEDTAPKSFILTAGTAVYAAAEGEPLDFTTEEDLELIVLSVDENGWALVELPDGTQGYILMPQEEAGPETEIETETETNEEADDTPKVLVLTSGMMVYGKADAEGDALLTAEEAMELNVLFIDENGWVLVELPDGTQGYVLMPTDNIQETETTVVSIKAETAIRLGADGMTAIIFIPDDDTEVTVLGVEGDWVKVELSDGTIGYIFHKDIDWGDEPEEKTYIEKKVTIFTSFRPIMKDGETITLTSLLEGFEDCVAIKYQWECDKGNGFEPVEGGSGDSYSYKATAESMTWSWQLVVYYK